jgi:uncharacterized protein YciI
MARAAGLRHGNRRGSGRYLCSDAGRGHSGCIICCSTTSCRTTPERRAAFRAEHLAYARRAHRRGELVLGGALADPVDGAVLLFRGPSPAAAEAFAAGDPYVRNGLVTSWRVRAWATVVGDGAEECGVVLSLENH